MELTIDKNIKLRHFRKSDLQNYFECFKTDMGKDSFLRYFTKPEQLEKEVESIISQYSSDKPTEETFVIEVNGEFAGFVDIEGLNSQTNPHKVNLGYGVREKFRGQGNCTKAVVLVCDYVFEKYNLRRIEANPRSDNFASIKVLEKAGFKLEGVLRNNLFQNGKIYNEMMFSKIK